MLSNKMTVSLMSLITILALAFAVSPAMAQSEFSVTFPDAPKVVYNATTGTNTVALKIMTGQPVAPIEAGAEADDDVKITALDKHGRSVPAENSFSIQAATGADAAGDTGTLHSFTITVPNVGTADQDNLPYTAFVQVKALTTIDPTVPTTGKANVSKPTIHTFMLKMPQAAVPTERPKVISIQRLDDSNQTVVSPFQAEKIPSEPFTVRIVISEKPKGIPDVTKTADELAKALVDIDGNEGTVSNLIIGTPFSRLYTEGSDADNTIRPHPSEGQYEHKLARLGIPPGVAGSGNVPAPTGADNLYYEYRVTVTPRQRNADFTLKVKLKDWEPANAQSRVFPNERYRKFDLGDKPNGREQLALTIMATRATVKAGVRVSLPNDIVIPAGGFLVITKNNDGSAVIVPPGDRTKAMSHYANRDRKPAEKLYNVYEEETLPNLASLFLSGAVVDLEVGLTLKITEVMWGENVSLVNRTNSQYIELYNPGTADVKTPGDDVKTFNKDERLTLVFYRANEFGDVPAKVAVAATATTPATTKLPAGVADRIGTLDAKGVYWNPATKGSSGSSGVPIQNANDLEVTIARTPITPITSMYRTMVPDTTPGAAAGAMMVEDGQMAASWMSSEGPKNANFDPLAIGIRHGTPGAATDATDTGEAEQAAADKAKADAAAKAAAAEKTRTTGTMPTDGRVYISEIMIAGGGVLPQWIEIANGAKEEVNLSGWTLTIANAAADADVSIGASAKFTIPDGTMIGAFGQQSKASTILVVTEAGRNNVDSSGQVVNLWKDNEVDLILAGVTKRKYTVLSADAFSITLAPPEPAATKAPAGETADAKAKRQAMEKKAKADRMEASDTVGNLGADGAAAWALPMSEDGRSSLIRRHVQVNVGPAEPEGDKNGNAIMMEHWVLASDTAFAQATHIRTATYYGAQNDVGTPGFRAGGALPVELSHFRPERKKDTGAVVITWSTQSELNNAGFFIKRSQQKDGEFKVINATMIAGAGTTSEKQFYTYTDTTAQPNVVYYYQIEDVSLDGNRQTLTRGIRLRGHVGATGKLTATWGELKTSHE